MKFIAGLLLAYSSFVFGQALGPDEAAEIVRMSGEKIGIEPIQQMAIAQNGRIKPFDTLARETILFITGRYSKLGLDPVQLYLAIASREEAAYAPLIEVRDPDLRVQLGYLKKQKYFSLADLENSPLQELARPAFAKQEEGGKLDEVERKITEAFHQMSVIRGVITGENLARAVDFAPLLDPTVQAAGNPSEVPNALKAYIGALKAKEFGQAQGYAKDLVRASRTQPAPELFRHYLDKLDLEIFFNWLRPFFISYLLALAVGLFLILNLKKKPLSPALAWAILLLPIVPLIAGLAMRVYITQFAPITNMYGTMIWVAFGVMFFSTLMFHLYRSSLLCGSMFVGAGLILLLTDQIPLVLSPDLDPIVAVLRSNFWLSTHVTTITISYAAFTIAMILGNIALVRTWFKKDNTAFFKEYSHYAYRMMQLGCFLLTVGIILGGIWADYSWGRFWGWDPKETWALIADLGFLALLHARHVGWIDSFKLLALAPVAYLLVVMAWYGVNFILAAGLHSYGFSSGGARAVGLFVGLQILLLGAGLVKAKSAQPKAAT